MVDFLLQNFAVLKAWICAQLTHEYTLLKYYFKIDILSKLVILSPLHG